MSSSETLVGTAKDQAFRCKLLSFDLDASVAPRGFVKDDISANVNRQTGSLVRSSHFGGNHLDMNLRRLTDLIPVTSDGRKDRFSERLCCSSFSLKKKRTSYEI